MDWSNKYYLVEGGEILAKVSQFRAELMKHRHAAMDYVKSIGGTGYQSSFMDGIYAIQFPEGQVPEGFKKPNRYKCCVPKVKSSYCAEFLKYKAPHATEWMKKFLGIPLQLNYSCGNSTGGSCTGHPFEPISICWFATDGPLLLIIPDVAAKAEELRNGKEIIFEDNADQWRMPLEGVREILREEWDFMAAKHKAAVKLAA